MKQTLIFYFNGGQIDILSDLPPLGKDPEPYRIGSVLIASPELRDVFREALKKKRVKILP